jgi:hypothetical protein
MDYFKDLLLVHHQIDELFIEHQRALILGEFETALRRLEIYEEHLVHHILDEEELMLPLYEARVEMPVGGTAEIFLNEHRKIREYLPLFKQEFTKLFAAQDRERAVIFLLDSETMFKKLLVHHDTRERKFLYALLDQVTNATERHNLFAKLRLRPNTLTAVAAAFSTL